MQDTENTAIIDDLTITDKTAGIIGRADVMASPVTMFFDEAACREWILKRSHPDGERCPGCHEKISPKQLERFYAAERVKCCSCGKFFTALTGTFLSGCQLSFAEVIALAMFLSPDITDKKIADVLCMSAANVRIWRMKFEAMEKLAHG
jgi:transposase-like protein